MNSSAVIQYRATSIPDLVEAVKAIRALGLSPDVKVSPPSSVIPPPVEAQGPEVKAYLTRTGEHHFKRNRGELDKGLTVEQAAEERNNLESFQGRKPLSPPVTLSDADIL